MATVVLDRAKNDRRFDEAIRVADMILEHYPKFAFAMEAKAAAYSAINDQWRICFRWNDCEAHGVEIVDYH